MSKLLILSTFFQEVACKLSSYLKIAALCLRHAEHYIIINGCKLLKILERVLIFNLNEPIKVFHLQKWANQPMLNGAIVIATIILVNARKTLFPWYGEKLSSEIKKTHGLWTMHFKNIIFEKVYIETRFLQAIYLCKLCSKIVQLKLVLVDLFKNWFAVERISEDERCVVHKKIA